MALRAASLGLVATLVVGDSPWAMQGRDAAHTGLGSVPGPTRLPYPILTLPTFGVSAGGLRSLSPVEDGMGRLFTVSAGPAGTLSVSAVVAASGVSIWNWTTASAGAASLVSTPAFADSSAVLFVSTGVGVSALNVATGTLVGPAYTPPTNCSVVGDPTANAFGGAFAVQIGCATAGIVSLSSTGALVWTATFNALVGAVAGFAPAVSIKGDVVVACATSAGSGPGLLDGVLVAANATTGAPLWTAPSPLQGGCAAPPMFTADPVDVFVYQVRRCCWVGAVEDLIADPCLPTYCTLLHRPAAALTLSARQPCMRTTH